MRPDRWRQVESLYHSALEREAPARDAFLREACREDEELRCEVRSLLDQTESGVLNRPLQLGPYQIVGVIGAGGMGTVYQARDTRLNRVVAIKVSEARFNARFEREARAVAALNHPHICTLYDVGPNYLVMEYVEGQPLHGPMPVSEALRLAIQMADALEAAHRKGIVHRDLKPGNVLVTEIGGEGAGFRPGQDGGTSAWRGRINPNGEPADGRRHHRRHYRLHVTRAGGGQAGGCAQRHFFVRRRALRNADRAARLSRRHQTFDSLRDPEGRAGAGQFAAQRDPAGAGKDHHAMPAQRPRAALPAHG